MSEVYTIPKPHELKLAVKFYEHRISSVELQKRVSDIVGHEISRSAAKGRAQVWLRNAIYHELLFINQGE